MVLGWQMVFTNAQLRNCFFWLMRLLKPTNVCAHLTRLRLSHSFCWRRVLFRWLPRLLWQSQHPTIPKFPPLEYEVSYVEMGLFCIPSILDWILDEILLCYWSLIEIVGTSLPQYPIIIHSQSTANDFCTLLPPAVCCVTKTNYRTRSVTTRYRRKNYRPLLCSSQGTTWWAWMSWPLRTHSSPEASESIHISWIPDQRHVP